MYEDAHDHHTFFPRLAPLFFDSTPVVPVDKEIENNSNQETTRMRFMGGVVHGTLLSIDSFAIDADLLGCRAYPNSQASVEHYLYCVGQVFLLLAAFVSGTTSSPIVFE